MSTFIAYRILIVLISRTYNTAMLTQRCAKLFLAGKHKQYRCQGVLPKFFSFFLGLCVEAKHLIQATDSFRFLVGFSGIPDFGGLVDAISGFR